MSTSHQSFENDGYVILQDFWKDDELNELQAQLDELGQLVVGPTFSSTDFSKYQLTPTTQLLLYDRWKD